MVQQDLRSYGRRRGRKLSPRQAILLRELLPRVAVPLDRPALGALRTLFDPPPRAVWLEIGFGGGEHLLWQAQHHPDVGFIGCEPFENGVVKVLSAIEGGGYQNVRIFQGDARELLPLLPEASIGRAFMLFPDPWPKKRHWKRRLVSEATLNALGRVLGPGGELRIATDIGDYARWILLAVRGQRSFRWFAEGPGDWRTRTADWPPTRYEQRAINDGRRCYYFRFTRI
jgi:tRNA (guanine-N7-)-methyltransferase